MAFTMQSAAIRTFSYRAQLFRKHRAERDWSNELLSWELGVLDAVNRFGAVPLASSRVVEIGHGQRPLRLMWMSALCADARGIDIETALLKFDLLEVARIAKREGVGRALKTGVRSALFDARHYERFADAYRARFGSHPHPPNLYRGDASDPAFWDSMDRLDLVYSEDVFEHIPRDKIVAICELVREKLRGGGLFLPNVNVFTSITGAHMPEWFRENLGDGRRKRIPPWGHLTRDDVQPDTYLNRLRLADYREIFSKHFTIEDEIEVFPGLGDAWLSDDVAQALPDYSREELLANNRRFILRV